MSVSVSETIGKLLLEGYKMLADSCEVCCTVLMQDRRGRIICVQCESASMANATQESMNSFSNTGKMSNGVSNSNQERTNIPRTVTHGLTNNNLAAEATTTSPGTLAAEDIIAKEIENASSTLTQLSQQQHDIQIRSLYVKYIRECAETLVVLKTLRK